MDFEYNTISAMDTVSSAEDINLLTRLSEEEARVVGVAHILILVTCLLLIFDGLA